MDTSVGDAPSLPVWAHIADALTLMLLTLAAWVVLMGGWGFAIYGLRISANNVPRLLSEAAAIFAVRHILVRAHPLHQRIGSGLSRLQPLLGVLGRAARVCARPMALALGVPWIVYTAVLVRGYDGGPYLRGDCLDYYRAARSILEDGDLDLSNQLTESLDHYLHGVSLTVDGRIVPKHPVLMPIASIPFVAALEHPGALVFNLVQLTCLLLVLYQLAKRWSPGWSAAIAVALTGIATFIPHYVWNYSPDVFAALVLASALLPLTSRSSDASARPYFIGGVLTGLAVVAKQPLVLFIPTTFVFCRRPFARSAGALAAGLLIPLGLFGLHNARLFGSPFVTAYDRIAYKERSELRVYSQRGNFDLPITEGMRGQLMDPQHGLIRTSPVTVVSLAGLPALAMRSIAPAVHLGAGAMGLFLFYSTYDQWNASHYGNRFLMPVVAFGAIPLAALIELLRVRRRR